VFLELSRRQGYIEESSISGKFKTFQEGNICSKSGKSA